MEYNRPEPRYLDAIKSDGTVVTNVSGTGVTLGVATYLIPFGSFRAPMPGQTETLSLHFTWAAAVAGTGTIEVSNFSGTKDGSIGGLPDITDYDTTTSGAWCLFNPTAAGALFAAATGGGNSFTALTLTLGGTNAGSAIVNLPTMGFQRVRLKLVLTAGGIVRVNAHGKVGA